MRALTLTSLDGPDALELAEMLEPEPHEDLITVDVHAAGAGFVDVLLSRGRYQIRPEPPFVPGIEFAGTVRWAPPGSGFEPGERVASTALGGGFAEVALAPVEGSFRLPDSMSFEQGAAISVNYRTAHLGLVRRGRLSAGEVLLVHGAAGGVGSAALQIGNALGARTIAVASGERKQTVALELGAGEALDAGGDWVAQVRELTAGRGADVVFDPVGGQRFSDSLRCMAPEGRLLVVGFADGEIPQLAVNRLLLKHLDVVGVNWGGFLPIDPALAQDGATAICELFERGEIDPLIGGRYELADGAQALRDIEARRITGKAVIVARP
ncbi:MAG TPA: NADPH:quinone oxidoreductase family protein [Solirubrobacteraceae bacterium]|nr:NADPH:quinone oxidoreductase family protein [Solirubrobacteraceae bacterium]